MSDTLLEKAWALLEKEGLQGLTPERLAFYCHVSMVQIYEFYPNPLSILLGLWSFIENRAMPLAPLPDLPQDNLFEQLMSVLETLQPYQPSIKRLTEELVLAPCWLKDMAPHALKWSRQALEKAGLPVNGFIGSLKTYSFAGFCFYIIQVWTTDDSVDKSLTMVKLDQGLIKLFEWILRNE